MQLLLQRAAEQESHTRSKEFDLDVLTLTGAHSPESWCWWQSVRSGRPAPSRCRRSVRVALESPPVLLHTSHPPIATNTARGQYRQVAKIIESHLSVGPGREGTIRREPSDILGIQHSAAWISFLVPQRPRRINNTRVRVWHAAQLKKNNTVILLKVNILFCVLPTCVNNVVFFSPNKNSCF